MPIIESNLTIRSFLFAVTLIVLSLCFATQNCLAQAVADTRTTATLSLDSKPSLSLSDDLDMSLTDRQIVSLLEEAARLEHGEGVSRDTAGARKVYCSAIALGSTDGMIRLGWMYANGRGIARDDAMAAGLFLRAAQAGNPMGERLATMFVSAVPKPTPCDQIQNANDKSGIKPSLSTTGNRASTALNLPGSIRLGDPAEFRKPMSSIEQKKLTLRILQMSGQFRLDPRLVLAVIQQESSFDPNAKSPKNAQGLMQLIPETAERFAVKNTYDPEENVRGGMSYLRWLLSYFKGDVSLVLAAYNAGEGTVDKYKGVPPFAETLAYVQRIRALYPFDRHPFDAKASAGRVSFVR